MFSELQKVNCGIMRCKVSVPRTDKWQTGNALRKEHCVCVCACEGSRAGQTRHLCARDDIFGTDLVSLVSRCVFPVEVWNFDPNATYNDSAGEAQFAPYVGGIQPGTLTMGKRFAELGYVTHLNGKWGIGGGSFLNTPMGSLEAKV